MDEVTGLLGIFREAVVASVRRDAPDLTALQLATLLLCCLHEPPHTIGGLAAELRAGRPAIGRAFDRLEELRLIRRVTGHHPEDRRSMWFEATAAGTAYVQQLTAQMVAAAQDGRPSDRTGAGRE
jgi:DNA-binding MarR family transcriptional regulator